MKKAQQKIQDLYPLSPTQEGILFHALYDGDSGAYFEQSSYQMQGQVDLELGRQALALLMERHAVLRTAFVPDKADRPLQVVLGQRELPFQVLDFRGLEDQPARISQFMAEDRKRGFDLTHDPLIRVAALQLDDDRYAFVWSHHHIILDGWCTDILITEFFEFYFSLAAERAPRLPEARPFKDYILWLEKQDQAAAAAFWEAYLADYAQAASLPVKQFQADGEVERASTRFYLDASLRSGLEQLAAANSVTLNIVLQCLWGILLARYADTEDVVYGGILSGRPPEIPGIESMTGLFVTMLPVRIRLSEAEDFAQLLAHAQEAHLKRTQFSYYPLVEIQRQHPLRDQLLSHLISFQNHPLADRIEGLSNADAASQGIEILDIESVNQTHYDFMVLLAAEDRVLVEIEYNAAKYEASMIRRLEGHFRFLAGQLVANPAISLSELQLCTLTERDQILSDFNANASPYSIQGTLQARWSERVARLGDRVAVRYDGRSLTFGEVEEKANQLARMLKARHGVERGDRIGVRMRPSERRIVALVAVLKLGGTFVPIDPDFPAARQAFMVEDAGLKTIVEEDWSDALADFDSAAFIPVGEPSDIAYLIYTSGSSGKPKGVPVSQASVLNFGDYTVDFAGMDDSDIFLHQLPFIFDVSVHETFIPLFFAGSLAVCDRADARDPARLKAFIQRYGVTQCCFVSGVYFEFLKSLRPEEVEGLRSLRTVFFGGEQVMPDTGILHARFFDFPAYNGYGPTESTIFTTYHACLPEESLIPIGKPLGNIQVTVRDRAFRLQPVGVPGELCIAGASLTAGYLNRPELTEAAFVPNPDPSPGYERLYRTGDIGYWTESGELMFLGRRDQQWKIRGYRVETGEVEAVMASFPGIQKAVVVPVMEGQHARQLVGWYTADGMINEADLEAFMGRELPDYMIPAQFSMADALPFTASGKVDRKKLQDASLEVERAAHVAPATATEQALAAIWEPLLGIEDIGRADDFFRLGGHSLKAIRLATLIGRELDRKVEVFDVFKHSTLEGLGAFLDGQHDAGVVAIPKLAEAEHYPVAPAQMRLWILEQLQTDAASYNLQMVFRLEGKLDRPALEEAFLKLVERFEILRTVFVQVGGVPRQLVLPVTPALHQLGFLDYSSESDPESAVLTLMRSLIRKPFDLEAGPLFKADVVYAGPDSHFCCFTMHHIITDWWSMDILIRDMVRLYLSATEAPDMTPAPLPIQYRDFAAWHQDQLSGAPLAELEQYWLGVFESLPPVVEMPADLGRPERLSTRGDGVEFTIDPQLAIELKALAGSADSSLFMVLLALVKLLLYRYTGETDLVTASPMTGRPHPQLEEQVGFFVDTVLIRSRLVPEGSFHDLLAVVRESTLGAYAHQSLPFHKLIELLDPVRDTAHAPLTDISVELLQGSGTPIPDFPGFKVGMLETDAASSNFDLGFLFHESGEVIRGLIQYRTDLFSGGRVEAFKDQLLLLMQAVCSTPDVPLHSLFKLSASHYQRVMEHGNGAVDPFPFRPFHAYIQDHVAERGDAPALVRGPKTVSYAELDRISGSIAARLQELVAPGAFIPILIPRSIELPVAMLAIQKAGGAYVPLDPEWPVQRIASMLETVQPEVLIGTLSADHLPEAYQDRYWQFDLETLPLRSCTPHPRSPDDALYGIFTSGTTGRPKCAVNYDKGLHNRLRCMTDWFDVSRESRFLLINQPVFDTTFWQTFLPLMNGGCCVIPEREGLSDLSEWVELLRYERISSTAFVPSVFRLFVKLLEELDLKDADFPALQHLMLGGEALNPGDLSRFRLRFPHLPITNLYGPTETAVGPVFHRLPESIPDVIPIGRPIRNTKALILDAHRNLVPPGAVGELYLGGICVGAGYLNDPVRTEAAFFRDPFAASDFDLTLYKTGDLARLDAEGRILFLGRQDHQVKLNGIRVELKEIESVLQEHPAIRQAVVSPVETSVFKGLAAWYCVSEAVSGDALKRFLKKRLPAYMVPAKLIEIEAFPRLSTGKLDRRSLPMPDSGVEDADQDLPEEGFESRLAVIWSEVLGISAPGADLNFFDAGGDSLKLIHLGTAINRAFGCKLDPIALVGHPTIRYQATRIKAFLGERVFQEAQSTSSSMVLRPFGASGPERPALYCFPPFSGYGIVYLDLARRFGEAFSPVLFSYKGFGPDEEVHSSLEAMYQSYLDLITAGHAVTEPVFLLGFSSGGKLAFEVCKRLEALGYSCQILMLESAPNSAARPVSASEMQFELEDLENEIRAYMGEVPDSDGIVERTRQVVNNFARLWADYSTSGQIRADILLLGGPFFEADNYQDWEKHTSGQFEARMSLEGSHRKLLEHDGNLEQIVQVMQEKRQELTAPLIQN